VQIGFVFGPRALRRICGREVDVVSATGIGSQRTKRKRFADATAIARFCVGELNGSLRRANIDTRVRVGAVATLDEDEARPFGPNPSAWLADLVSGHVRSRGRSLPLECWAGLIGASAIVLLLDWGMTRGRIQRNAWAGFAPRGAILRNDELVFHPVLLADLNCALTAHTLAHEFGHVLGCSHENEPTLVASNARAFAPADQAIFSVMAAARASERGRRLEWSRPGPGGQEWQFGDAQHDEAAWLRFALPRLARQRFACHAECGGACAELARLV
jgi:hypothetical protein